MTRSSHQSTKRVAGRQGKKTAQGKTPAKLLVANWQGKRREDRKRRRTRVRVHR